MVGLLLFFATISIVPIYFCGFIFLYVVFFRRKELTINLKRNNSFLIGIVIIVFLCCLNVLIHGSLRLPNFILLPFTVLISFGLNKKDLKWFLILCLFEVGIGCAEQVMGISSILPSNETVDFADEELLYFRKAAGISSGPAGFGLKLLVAIMIVYVLGDEIKPLKRIIICTLLYLGIITTFTRTVLIIALLFIIFQLLRKYKDFLFHTFKGQLIIFSVVSIAVLGIYKVADTILFQLARGGESVDISGRDEIWEKMFSFIKENILLGNGSLRYTIPYHDGSMAHAHNSFIQLFADHGVLIAVPFLLLIICRFNERNYPFLIFLLLTSFAQFTIFWAFSVPDVFFYAFLCNILIGVNSFSIKTIKKYKSHECIQSLTAFSKG